MGEEQGFLDRAFSVLGSTGLGFLWFIGLAIWGGTANYLARIKRNAGTFSMMELVGEWTVSAFAGVITAFFCLEYGLSFYATAALTGVSGHMGGKAITMFEGFFAAAWRRMFGGTDGNTPS